MTYNGDGYVTHDGKTFKVKPKHFKEQASRLRGQKIEMGVPELTASTQKFIERLATMSDTAYSKFSGINEVREQMETDYPLDDWTDPMIEMMIGYLEEGNPVPEDPMLVCVGCKKEERVQLSEWIAYRGGGYHCTKCDTKNAEKRFIYRCAKAGFPSGAWNQYRLKEWDQSKHDSQKALYQIAVDYINNPSKSLWIYGITGVGKTHFVSMIGIHLLYHKKKVRYIRFSDLLKICTKSTNYLEWRSIPILIIDDFEECDTFARKEQQEYMIDDILNSRYNDGRITIVTTNMTVDCMQSSKNDKIQKLYSRTKDKKIYQRVIFPMREDLREYYSGL